MREPDWPGEGRPPELLEYIEELALERRRAILAELERDVLGLEPAERPAILSER